MVGFVTIIISDIISVVVVVTIIISTITSISSIVTAVFYFFLPKTAALFPPQPEITPSLPGHTLPWEYRPGMGIQGNSGNIQTVSKFIEEPSGSQNNFWLIYFLENTKL